VGFSGGKDSTLLLHLVVETLLQLPPDERTRRVYVLSNDTRVESPVFQDSVNAALDRVRAGLDALGLPMTVVQTRPDEDSSFWVNLLGRGYPAPNRNFRWCTDRLKIRPTSRFIKERISEAGEVILLLGVRRAESASRAGRINAYDEKLAVNARLNAHNDIAGCLIFRPIVDLSDDDVWQVLLALRPPWGGSHRELVTLYRNAKGGECPFVMTDDDAPSCGSNSARFGCWTCTVVEKDHSLNGLIDAGFEHLEPLAEFRERIKSASADPECRSKVRRNGQPGLGPLTLGTRRTLLAELIQVQRDTGLPLLSQHEIRLIHDWWGRDETELVVREIERLVQLGKETDPT
jgi:DNA sulfur modification protein DndC